MNASYKFIGMFLLSIAAFGSRADDYERPAARQQCRSYDGEIERLRIGGEVYRLCRIEGSAIELETFWRRMELGELPEAVQTYIEHPEGARAPTTPADHCVSLSGRVITNDEAQGLCVFSDDSAIELETLGRSVRNRAVRRLYELLTNG